MNAILNKYWLCGLLVLGAVYSCYEALDIYLAGSIDSYCKGGVNGAACHYSEKIGVALFGANQAHVGYALFLLANALILLVFCWIVYRAGHRSSGLSDEVQ